MMPDPISTAIGAIGATKSALEVVKAMADFRDATKLNTVKFELTRLLLEAIEAQSTLVADKRDLEERIRQLEAWDGEKQRYQLAEVGRGTFAFVLKPDAQGSDPPHMACANCFNQGRRSILQRNPQTLGGRAAFDCPSCQTKITINPPNSGEPSSSRRVNLGGDRGPNSWMGK